MLGTLCHVSLELKNLSFMTFSIFLGMLVQIPRNFISFRYSTILQLNNVLIDGAVSSVAVREDFLSPTYFPPPCLPGGVDAIG